MARGPGKFLGTKSGASAGGRSAMLGQGCTNRAEGNKVSWLARSRCEKAVSAHSQTSPQADGLLQRGRNGLPSDDPAGSGWVLPFIMAVIKRRGDVHCV